MKRIWVLVIVVCLLCGCSEENAELSRCLALREKLIQSKECHFSAEIISDYGDKTYSFSMTCLASGDGGLSFEVKEPESISGITGVISSMGGKLTFDDTALAFGLLADGRLSPVSAPWLLLKTLRSGYLTSCGMDGTSLRMTVNDSYEEEALQVDIWLGDNDLPVHAEFSWQGCRVLSLTIEEFTIV